MRYHPRPETRRAFSQLWTKIFPKCRRANTHGVGNFVLKHSNGRQSFNVFIDFRSKSQFATAALIRKRL